MYSAVSKAVRHLLLRPMPAMTQIALKRLLANRRAHAVRLTETMVRSVCAGGGTRACSVSARQCAAALPHNRICRKGADVCSGERACPCSSVLRGPVVRSVSAGGGTGSRVPGRAASQQGGALLLCPPTGSAEMVLNCDPGERACPCSSILSGLVVRSVCAGGGTLACSVSASRCAAALPHNRICRDAAADMSVWLPSGGARA